MPTFSPRDVHIPEDGQTVITLAHPYVIGSQELMVYLNGLVATTPDDYIEVDNLHIEFKYQLAKDDVIITQQLVMYDDKFVVLISDSSKSLFQRYGTETRLLKNQNYTMTLRYGDKELISKFYTQFDPQYVAIQTIRADLGEFVSKITDFQIAYLIYQNSITAGTKFTDYFDIDDDSGLGTLNTTDGVVPYKVRQFVRYRTELDLVTQIYLQLMGQSGSDHIVLGALEVEKRSNLGDITPLLALIKTNLNQYARTGSSIVSAVKGGGTTFPLTTPRQDWVEVSTSSS
jgi:hypothetical protein